MNIIRETLHLPVTPHTIGWHGPQLVSRENGEQYYPEYDAYPAWRGMSRGMGYGFGEQFDRAVTSPDGQYTLLCTAMGTKGLLLRGARELVREVNRSYYQAEAYEYPATFFTARGRTFLAHCPLEYCRLDFEDVETGEIVTQHPGRKPGDFFHSRLEVSPGGRYMVSKGWMWHPVDGMAAYTVEDCLDNPLLLDESPLIEIEDEFEFTSAGFVNDRQLLLMIPGEDGPSLGWWDMDKKEVVRRVPLETPCFRLLPIDEDWAWDLYEHPKLIDLQTGKVEWSASDIDCGTQASSIIWAARLRPVAWNREEGKLAIGGEDRVEVLSLRR